MKVGDLVKCVAANGEIGLIVERTTNWSLVIWRVLLKGETYPFRAHQLEILK